MLAMLSNLVLVLVAWDNESLWSSRNRVGGPFQVMNPDGDLSFNQNFFKIIGLSTSLASCVKINMLKIASDAIFVNFSNFSTLICYFCEFSNFSTLIR